tara:strand:- start:841 stop:1092 length:252 start_codon:yes stop_codon:yes gene_type:complete
MMKNDLDDDNNQFLWWLGELGVYLFDCYKYNLMDVLAKNPEIAAKSAELMREQFMKGIDPHSFGDMIVPKEYPKVEGIKENYA